MLNNKLTNNEYDFFYYIFAIYLVKVIITI